MKKTTLTIILTAFIAIVPLCASIAKLEGTKHMKYETSTEESKTIIEKEETAVDTWDLFVEAVIWRESRGNANAIGDGGKAVGVLQIHPIMVREANRIIAMKGGEKETYTYADRYSREKSIEMFKIVQDFHNKEHDMVKALQIWNKNHPDSYRNDIMSKYNAYLNGEETTNNINA